MKTLHIEWRKEKRSGIILVFILAGGLGALYALVNFVIRKETLLSLPMDPMDLLLTQLYGMILILNLFAIITSTCMMYLIEFKGNAIQKMHQLPVHPTRLYGSKLIILFVLLTGVIVVQNLTLAGIGMKVLPQGAFEWATLLNFAGYSLITALPVLTLMLFAASRFKNMWVPIGIGVAGFLSGMALAPFEENLFLLDPFVVMLKPAVMMQAEPSTLVVLVAAAETIIFLALGLWTSKRGD